MRGEEQYFVIISPLIFKQIEVSRLKEIGVINTFPAIVNSHTDFECEGRK
jgi:hypothetical protein